MVEALLQLGDTGRLLDLLCTRGSRGLVPAGLVKPVAAVPGGTLLAPDVDLGWYVMHGGKQ